MIILVLLYVFNDQINKWWWTVRPLTLEPRIKSWIETYSVFYNELDTAEKQQAESQISRLMLTKEYTLKGKKDFQLEEDMKALIAHEMYRLTRGYADNYSYDSCDRLMDLMLDWIILISPYSV
jgi:Mlc titration factor MtfA (ptsG expression regulator)